MKQALAASAALLSALLITPGPAQDPGFGGRGGPGGRGGMSREKVKLVEKFDEDQSGLLERSERDAAREWLKENGNQGRRRGRRFGRGRGTDAEPPEPGAPVSPETVATYPDRELYDTSILRTLFFEFEHDDWEAELEAFYRSDVEVPATLVVDGESLQEVGVRFRGNTSFMMVPPGRKRPLNVSIDFAHADQRLGGYKTLNLLNGHSDPSFLCEVLHAIIGLPFTPVPQANLVHVVINGESWGVYGNVQQVNRDFLKEAYGTRGGARWRVPPNFGGGSGLAYLGDDPAQYDRSYQAKSGVDDAARQRLVEVCRVLNETDVDTRRKELPSLLDIDGALWFLAIDNVLLDGDGYLTRASDYILYVDPTGVFHPVTYDNNEILRGSRGRGGPGGMRGGGPAGGPPPGGDPRGGPPDRGGDPRGDPRGDRPPDRRGRQRGGRGRGGPGGVRIQPDQSPLAGSDDENRPLLHRLLQVPEWRARYLAHVHSLVTQAVQWDRLGPEVERLHGLIADITHADTRKLYDNEAFDGSTEELRKTTERRCKALLEHPTLAGPWPAITAVDAEETVATGGHTLHVAARTGGDVEIAEAWLHWQLKRPGPFAAVAMRRGDDGVFRAEIPPQAKGEKIHYYVEVRSAGDSGRVAFFPAGASSKAQPHWFGK